MTMSKIYTDKGFVNWDYLFNNTRAFCMVTGPRATGKTYGLFKFLIEQNIRFLYLRRLKTQLEQCSSEAANPFKKLNYDLGWNIQPFRSKALVRFSHAEMVDGKSYETGDIVAYGAALSTFATMRGMDFSDIDAIVFDEAIPMEGEKPIKDEFNAFLHFYESVNRNRELEGKAPVKCFLLGNANKLSNPYYAGWRFMRTALKMIRGGQMLWRSPDNTRIMVMLLKSPISERKKATVLYQNGSADFISNAIDNAFRTDATNIHSYSRMELLPLCGVGEIGIHKLRCNGKMYVSKIIPPKNYYEAHGIHLKRFRHDYAILKTIYLNNDIIFEDYDIELLFREMLDI